jgi:hypothetical protein
MVLVIEPWAYWSLLGLCVANALVNGWKAWVWRSLLKKQSAACVTEVSRHG